MIEVTDSQLQQLTFGEYFNYPSCCIKAFVFDHASTTGVFLFSGFVPCESCQKKLKGLSYRQAVRWLGRDPKKKTRLNAQKLINTSNYQIIRTRLLERYVITEVDSKPYKCYN